MRGVPCCIDNAPEGTSLREVRRNIANVFEQVLQASIRLSKPWSRKRLLAPYEREALSLAADIYSEAIRLVTTSSVFDAVEGNTDTVASDNDLLLGYFSIAVALN